MTKILPIFIVTVLIFLSGCAGKIPQKTMDNNAALSITVGLSSRNGVLTVENVDTTDVYFIRLENESDDLKKEEVFISNYSKTPFMAGFQMDKIDTFCFDLPPGIYAAVAAKGVGVNSRYQYYTYFPKDMIVKTIVKLDESSIRHMGEYDLGYVSYTYRMNDPDDVQKYYYNSGLIDGVAVEKEPRKPTWTYPVQHSPSLRKFENSLDDEIDFLDGVKGSFSDTDWNKNITSRLNAL